MNYIELINNFWIVSEREDLSPHDQSTYFALLKYCNSLSWLNPFVCHWEILIQYSKTSKNSFYKSCDKLDEIGLIKWEKGQRNSNNKPKIFVLDFKNKQGTNREQTRNNEGTTREHGGNLNKLLNLETIKLINSNATLVNDHLKKWIDQEKGSTPTANKNNPEGFEFFFENQEFSEWWSEFLKVKKKKKASVNDRALTSQLKKIEKWSQGKISVAIEILENSIHGGWSDIYEPKPIKNINSQINATKKEGAAERRERETREFLGIPANEKPRTDDTDYIEI